MDGGHFILDEDSIEVEGLPDDDVLERMMRRGSLSLLRAMQAARGEFIEAEEPERERDYIFVAPATENPFAVKCGMAFKLAESVARDFGVDPEEMLGMARRKRLVHPRAVIAMVLRKRGWSYPQIARAMGRKDHSTALNAVDKFDIYARQNDTVAASYARHVDLMTEAGA